MIEILETSPCYVTVNQPENWAQADHILCNPLPHTVFKRPKSQWGVQVFWAWAAHSPCLAPHWVLCNKCCTFLDKNLVSADWLYCIQASVPKFGSLTEIDGNFVNLIIPTKNSIGNMVLNGEKLKSFPLRLGTRPGCHLSLQFFNIVLKF